MRDSFSHQTHTSQAEKRSKRGRGRILTVSVPRAGSREPAGRRLESGGNLQIKELCGPCWESQGTNYWEQNTKQELLITQALAWHAGGGGAGDGAGVAAGGVAAACGGGGGGGGDGGPAAVPKKHQTLNGIFVPLMLSWEPRCYPQGRSINKQCPAAGTGFPGCPLKAYPGLGL